MRILQNFTEEEKREFYKDFASEGSAEQQIYLEMMTDILDIAYTLAQSNEYIKFATRVNKENNTLKLSLELEKKEDRLANLKRWLKFINILEHYDNFIGHMQLYILNPYAQEFLSEIKKESFFWDQFVFDLPIRSVFPVEDFEQLEQELFTKVYDIQKKLKEKFNKIDNMNEDDKVFIAQLKSVYKNINNNFNNLDKNIDKLLSIYGEILVINLELYYQPVKKGALSFKEIKQHRQKFFNGLSKKFTLEYQYYGFVWQLKFNQFDRLKFHILLFFNPKLLITNNPFKVLRELWGSISDGRGFIRINEPKNLPEDKISALFNLPFHKTGIVQVNDQDAVKGLKLIAYRMTKLSFHLKPNLGEIIRRYGLVQSVPEGEDEINLDSAPTFTSGLLSEQVNTNKPDIKKNTKPRDGDLFSTRIFVNKYYNHF